MTVGASFRRRDLLRNLAILPSESNIHLVRQQDFIVDPASCKALALLLVRFAYGFAQPAKVRLRTASFAQDDAQRYSPLKDDALFKVCKYLTMAKLLCGARGQGTPELSGVSFRLCTN